MANAAALIHEGLWHDRDFARLDRRPQCMYVQVLSTKDLDTAGVLTLHPELLAKGCSEMTPADVLADLEVLEQSRFVVVDVNTFEVLVRSYVRLVSIKSPNAWKSVAKNARLIRSQKVRVALAAELRRIRRKDAEALADELDPIETPSESLSDPISNPSQNGTPSERGSNPPSSVPVLGHLTLVSTQVGERPSEFCNKHPNGTDDSCRPCAAARKSHPQRLAEWREACAAERQRAIDDCSLCDDHGDVEVSGNSIRKCDHQQSARPANA